MKHWTIFFVSISYLIKTNHLTLQIREFLAMHVQYVSNEKGQKTAVQIPLKQWESIKKEIKKLEVFEDLKNALNEMKQYKEGEITTPTIEALLSELK